MYTLMVMFLMPFLLADANPAYPTYIVSSSLVAGGFKSKDACTNAGEAHNFSASKDNRMVSWMCVPDGAAAKLEVVPKAPALKPERNS